HTISHIFSGWSYTKGEPLLIYEYMPNGSLDQHLFCRSGALQQHPTHIHRWDTRYNIVKDIATRLHYVHHEYEPIVLHRDIKASNVMVDSTFQARLGDFGLACVVAEGKNSYTDIDWVWQLHQEADTLLDAVDPILTTNGFEAHDAKRLLLLGLACSSPNPSDRPTMMEALHIITKSAPPPEVPLEKPRFVWPPEEGHSLSSGYNTELSIVESSLITEVEMAAGGHASACGLVVTTEATVSSSVREDGFCGILPPLITLTDIYHYGKLQSRRV
ncbi:probable L-type lectin-domain containing receptor kinase S.5, partial [Setaria viridis]|uniref:probable L-type lectin-domain containing receptor kinase S.5 n=1 Tax=Setaria viridis TaxID=4556 RepID=UPI003B3AB2A8